MIEDDEWEYPIGGPCGWMWPRKKEKPLAQDNNPNHLPAGSPNSTGGQFTPEEGGGGGGSQTSAEQKKDDKSYLKDAIYPAPDLFDVLPIPTRAALKTFSVLKAAPGLSHETILWLEKHFIAEESEKAFAGVPKDVLKEEKTLSNFFEKKGKGSSPKEHVNKYAEKSKANPNARAEKAKLEREALSTISFRMPKVTQALFDAYEKMGGHIQKFHLNMTEEALVKRAKDKSASALNSMQDLLDTYEKALQDPKNIERIKNLLDAKADDIEIPVSMSRNIGRYVRKGAQKSEPANKATFILRRGVKNGETTFYPLTVKLTKGK